MGIPYTMYGGISFYQRKEIKDLLAYLRVIVNPKDEESLKRIINYPVRGIGKTSIDKAVLFANENNISMWDVLVTAPKFGYKAGALESIESFVTMIKMFQSELRKRNAYDIAFMVGKQSGLIKDLFDRRQEGDDAIQRYENIQELLNSIKEFTETPSNEEGEVGDKGLGAYLQQITLLTNEDEKDENADTVKLMTIHSAKGLEFGCVFACGLEEMLFPNAMSINTREELEEERRLFYVVITRAKHKLWITYANTRYKFGQLVQNEPSRFIDEIPKEFLDRSFAGGGMKNQPGPFDSWASQSAFERMNRGFESSMSDIQNSKSEKSKPSYLTSNLRQQTKEHIPSPDFKASDTSNLQVGQKVEHQKFGFGEVMKMEGAAHNPVATVKFEHNGEKKIMLNYAKLRIVG
jgi:DNA helicase-2/ATP-dependent DNA helicase PcrA